MTIRRFLIVNADDFGQSPGINRGIIQAHEQGIVTSASLMVRWPAAVEAANYCREHPTISAGLHLDLGEWVSRDGTYVPLYEVVPMDDLRAVQAEVSFQLATFRRLLGRDPSHLDSHQHVHHRDLVRPVMTEIARKLGVPLRQYTEEVRYCWEFYGQTEEGLPLTDAISVDGMLKILRGLPEGFTELACHPGEEDGLETPYRTERTQEVKTLCDPRIRTAIKHMEMQICSFDTAARKIGGGPASRGWTIQTGTTD